MANGKYSRVYVEITDICNKSCSFCPGTVRTPRRMTRDEFSKVLEKLTGVTEHIYFHLMGEPLTHPEVAEFTRMAKEAGYKSMITTNGTLLPRLGKALVDNGIYKVNISIHSFEGTDASEHSIYLHGCLDFAEYAAKCGVLVTLRLWNGGTDADNSLAISILRERFGTEWTKNNRGAKLRDRIFLEHADRFSWPDMNADDLGDGVYCHGLGDHFGVLSDGSIVPCCLDREGEITLGNIFKDDIASVLASERAEAMRNGFRCRRATEELCRKCGYARRF